MSDGGITDREWRRLCRRVERGSCTPIIGSRARFPHLPSGAAVAEALADDEDYPLPDRDELAQVAQYVATTSDPDTPAEVVRDILAKMLAPLDGVPPSHFARPGDPIGYLATLRLPVYVTTNYDDLIERALRAHGRTPVALSMPWREHLRRSRAHEILDLEPTPDEPLVFHLHGVYTDPASMVITEADWLEFLLRVASDGQDGDGTAQGWALPPAVRDALNEHSLVFLGYRQEELGFRLLLRGLRLPNSNEGKSGVAVQLEDVGPPGRRDEVKRYVHQYVNRMSNRKLQLFWGNAGDFVQALDRHLDGSAPSEPGNP